MRENDETISYSSMNDVELLKILNSNESTSRQKEKVKKELYERYENQIHKNWLRLCAQMDNTELVLSAKEDFYGEAKIEFFKAISKIKMERIKDDKFKCVGMVDWYFKNLRSKFIKNLLKSKKVQSTTLYNGMEDENDNTVDSCVEESYWENEGYTNSPEYVLEQKESERNCSIAIKKCYNKWNDFERQVYRMLSNGKSRKEIAELTHSNVSKIYLTTKSMKFDMKKALGVI